MYLIQCIWFGSWKVRRLNWALVPKARLENATSGFQVRHLPLGHTRPQVSINRRYGTFQQNRENVCEQTTGDHRSSKLSRNHNPLRRKNVTLFHRPYWRGHAFQIFSFKQQINLTVPFIVSDLEYIRSFIRIRCKVMKIWGPKFANVYNERNICTQACICLLKLSSLGLSFSMTLERILMKLRIFTKIGMINCSIYWGGFLFIWKMRKIIYIAWSSVVSSKCSISLVLHDTQDITGSPRFARETTALFIILIMPFAWPSWWFSLFTMLKLILLTSSDIAIFPYGFVYSRSICFQMASAAYKSLRS